MTQDNVIQKQELIRIIFVFIITRVFILVIGTISFTLFPMRGEVYQKKPIPEALNFEKMWNRFDSCWYLKETKEGYPQRQFTVDKQETWAFLPLYPILIKGCSYILHTDPFWAGIVISNLCSFLALLLIYKLIKEKFKQGLDTITLILVSSGSFYLSIVYTEGLFIFLTALVFYLTHKKVYALALIFAGLATITKIQGCMLFLIPGIEILLNSKRTFYRYIPAFIISLIPISLLMLYLGRTSGESLAFLKMQAAWGSFLLFPLQGFIALLKGERLITSVVNSGFWIMNLGIVLSCYKKLPLSYVIFTIAYFLLCTSNEIVHSTTRYMLSVLPIFIAVMMSHKYVYQFFIAVNLLFLALTITAFVTGTGNFI